MDNNSFQNILNVTGVRVAIIGALCILSLFLLAETIHTASGLSRPGSPATDTITVQGTGEATLPPDIARVSFTVENTAETVAQAQGRTNEQAREAKAAVTKFSILDKDVKTLSYNISPRYSYPNCTTNPFVPCDRDPVVTGYRVSETVQVTVRNLENVNALLAALGDAGVQNVNGPAFALEDTNAGYNAARAEAIAEAKTQAGVLARQLGVSLGKIVNFNEFSGGYPYPYPAYGLGMGGDTKASSVPEISPGENTYSASVSITYEIR